MEREELNHIDPAELLDLVTGQVSEARAQEIERHLDTCGACQAELTLARSFHEQAGDEPLAPEIAARLEVGLDAARPRAAGWRLIHGRPGWVRAGLLAASVMFVVLGINALRDSSPDPGRSGTMRDGQPAVEWDLQLGEPGSGTVAVSWPAVEGASEYEIHVQSTTGQTLWTGRAVDSPFTLTLSELPEAVRSERFLFVTLVARMTDGTQQATRPHPLPESPQAR
jgi:hypothetical protein